MAERCPTCGFDLDEARRQIEDRDEIIAGLERELRGKRSQIRRLQNDRAQQRELDPMYPEAELIFNYWRDVLQPKAREFAGARLEKVLARLHAGHPVEEIKRAIDGCGRSHFHTRKGHTDLELICRDEQHLARFVRLAGAAAAPEPAPATNGNGSQLAFDADPLARRESVIDAVRRVLR